MQWMIKYSLRVRNIVNKDTERELFRKNWNQQNFFRYVNQNMNHLYFLGPMLNSTKIKQNNLVICSMLLEDNTVSQLK